LNRLYPTLWDHQWHPLVELRRALEELIAREALAGSEDLVVDVGCGDRPYEPLFTRRGARYIGCDLDEGAEVVIRPGEPIPLADESASGVVSFQVLEHVWDLDWYLGECRRMLRPGGWLVLSTHGVWPYHPHPTDYRRWMRDGLMGELQARGFEVESIVGLGGPLAWTTEIRLLGVREVLRRIPVIGPMAVAALFLVGNPWMVIEDKLTPASIRATNACNYLTFSRRRGQS
jgi:SAM-dependent methyltransferase